MPSIDLPRGISQVPEVSVAEAAPGETGLEYHQPLFSRRAGSHAPSFLNPYITVSKYPFHDFESTPFVDGPTHAEADRLLRARFRRPWAPGEEVRVQCDHSTWSSLCTAANRGEPVLYQSSDDSLVLIAASESYAIKSSDGQLTRLSGGKPPAGRRSSGQLLDHWMSGRDASEDVRGIFSGTIRPTFTSGGASAKNAAAAGPAGRR